MTGIINVDTIASVNGANTISVSNMQRRIIQRTSYIHRIGFWRGNNAYYWVPGGYMDFRPLKGDSRIRVTYSIPTRDYGSNHMIMHWIFYVNDVEYGRFTRGGHHVEDAGTTEWDVPSWGANTIARVGFRARSYSEGNHNAHLYMAQYWNGGGNSLRLPGQMIVEEYTSAPT